MRLVRLVSACLLLVLATAPTALAGGPYHEKVLGTDIDDNFCGTGETVNISFKGVFNRWDDRTTGHISEIFTNPDNGVSVVSNFGGRESVEVVDDGDGAYTVVIERTGPAEHIRYLNGSLLSQDVGRVIFYHHFDADDNYLGTDIVVQGPHPSLEAGFIWCDMMIEALGL